MSDYYETLPGKLSLRLNDPDLGLSEEDKKEFVAPVEELIDEVLRLRHVVYNQESKIRKYKKEAGYKLSKRRVSFRDDQGNKVSFLTTRKVPKKVKVTFRSRKT